MAAESCRCLPAPMAGDRLGREGCGRWRPDGGAFHREPRDAVGGWIALLPRSDEVVPCRARRQRCVPAGGSTDRKSVV